MSELLLAIRTACVMALYDLGPLLLQAPPGLYQVCMHMRSRGCMQYQGQSVAALDTEYL